jgi:hypothetical protein
MHPARLRELIETRPFRTLVVELVNDRSLEIRTPDHVRIHDDNRTCIVDQDSGSAVVIDIHLVQAVFQLPARPDEG